MKPFKTIIVTAAALGLSYTWAQTVKEFHVFLPQNYAWQSAVPLINEDGKTHELVRDPEHCGWYYRRYVNEALPQSALIYRDDDTAMQDAFGVNGTKNYTGTTEPIRMAEIFELFATDADYNNAIYFVADEDEADKLPAQTMGWFSARPANVQGQCSFNFATLIYDTDASLHPAFSCWAAGASATNDGCQAPGTAAAQGVNKTTALKAIYDCMGVTTGIVESTLSQTTKKPSLTAAGKKCFIDETYFNQLFNITSNVNEASCFDIPFTRSNNGWEFNSDNFVSPGLSVPVRGGFYPVEAKTDVSLLATSPAQTPVAAARTKRSAEGPVFYGPALRVNDSTTQIPKIDTYCNGPGWNGGYNCEGLFADGETTAEAIQTNLRLGPDACIFGWSCDEATSAPENWSFFAYNSENAGTETSRWTSQEGTSGNGGRNLHFCSESHSNFYYKKGLKFSISGSDDIWVYIDNKLAVDLGGTHLSAPGFVDLDTFMPNAVVGQSYDIDIFTCNRRATSSDLRINTNLFLYHPETSGISVVGKQDLIRYRDDGSNVYKICYRKSSGSACASATVGDIECCGDEILSACHMTVSYLLTQDKTGQDPAKIRYSEQEFAANPKPFNGAIDVSNSTKPIINENKLADVLPSGKYYLLIKIGNDTKAIEINIKGSVDIANRNAVIVDEEGNKSLPIKVNTQALASAPSGSPNVNLLIPLYIGTVLEPCVSAECDEPQELHRSAGASYALASNNNKVMFYEKKNGTPVQINPSTTRIIGESGIDTVYATIPAVDMESTEEKATINVIGSSRKIELTFFISRFAFVDSDSTYNIVSADKDTEYRLKSATYDFYIVALNTDNTICTDCNFPLTLGPQCSAGLELIGNTGIVNGRAKITIASSLEYTKNGDRGLAQLQITGPLDEFHKATYSNMQFKDPSLPVQINGTLGIKNQRTAHNAPAFNVAKTGALEFSITTDTPNTANRFAVMDMKGQVVAVGTLNNNDTRVKVPTTGSYIVKVGRNHKRVNVR